MTNKELEILCITPSDKAIEMLNELMQTSTYSIGRGKQLSRELTVCTIVYQDMKKLFLQLGTSDTPLYNIVLALIDSGCTEMAINEKWA